MTAALSTGVREYTWRITQGAKERLIIPIFEEDGVTAKTVDGWTVDAAIKDRAGGDVLYTWPAPDVLVAGTEVALTIPAPVSTAWTWLVGWYRVKLTDPTSPVDNPSVARVLHGTIFLDLD